MEYLHLLLSVIVWFVWVVATIAFAFIAAAIWLLTMPFDKRGIILHLASSIWGYMYALVNPYWTIRFEGRNNIRDDQPCIIISNHQSLADIMVLYGLLRNFKWVSKIQNFRIPFLGFVMRLNRYIEVDRMKGRSYLKMLARCEEEIRRGNSVLIFPEGTRSPDGRMHRFREGAFRLAVRVKVPIVPVIIDGTHEALPKKGFIFKKRKKIIVRVLSPVPPSSWGTEDPGQLMQIFQNLMESELNKLRANQ